MDLEELRKIKERAIIALFSDDKFMDRFVLKGGNAIDLIYKLSGRASMDIDLSIAGDLDIYSDLKEHEDKIIILLENAYREINYHAFDISLSPRPLIKNPKVSPVWGGYRIEFKLINRDEFKKFGSDPVTLRRNSQVVGLNQERKFKIDISKYEFCERKDKFDLEGYVIYVYEPVLIVIEKLRAICQQMPEYSKVAGVNTQRARARDFFDIYLVMESKNINFGTPENIQLIKQIFEIKQVPVAWIGKIDEFREFHKADFQSVIDTVKPDVDLKEFDFYFDYVINKCKGLESLWEI